MKIPDGLFEFIEAWDDNDLPDGAWWAKLEEGVVAFNKCAKTNVDPFDGVSAYVDAQDPDFPKKR